MSVVVTLVHGTFARLPGRDAAWTRDGSLLRERLSEELGGDVLFQPFRWSGMNWPSARYRAASRLREHFRLTSECHPERSHYVVAHSHGGNVVLYALRGATDERSKQELPDGVVCLSTPFIAVQPRPVTLFRFVATYTVVLVALFAVVATLMGRLLVPMIAGAATKSPVLNAVLWNEIWLEFVVCALLSWRATNALARLAHKRRDVIAVDSVPVPMRIYRSIGDEATAVLVTSALFTSIATLAWRAASVLTMLVSGAFVVLLLGLLAVPVGALLVVERLSRGSRLRRYVKTTAHSRRSWAVLATMGTMLAFAMWGYFLAGTPLGTADRSYAAVVAGLVLAVVAFSALSGLGYGITAPFLEVSAETTPLGSWPVHLFAARTWDVGEPARCGVGGGAPARASLSHSAAYGDVAVISDIAAWIREGAATRESSRRLGATSSRVQGVRRDHDESTSAHSSANTRSA